MKWLALFSQTGNELKHIIERTGRKPNFALTNRLGPSEIDNLVPICYIPNKPNASQYNYFFKNYDIITLHGYLRIIPPDACNHLLYNGHPAAIHLYPELKGKDKQEDVFVYKDKYPRMGAVIHKVTAEVDSGEIVICRDIVNDTISIDDAYTKLFEISVHNWVMFVQNRPNIGESV
jgi:hypothetical protein